MASAAHTITGVATSITAFVGYTARGRDNRATRIFSFADYERAFGGLAADSELSYAVNQFFDNGGADAYVVRVPKSDAASATLNLHAGVAAGAKLALGLVAISKGAWANRVVVDVDYAGVSDSSSFNLALTDRSTGTQELFSNLSADAADARYCVKVLNDPDNGSTLVSAAVGPADKGARPAETGTVGGAIDLGALDNLKDYSIKVAADLPTGLRTAVEVRLLGAGAPLPRSVL
ncbi:MAG: phage tail protein, partial [Burkholderiales bacterium PBB5]